MVFFKLKPYKQSFSVQINASFFMLKCIIKKGILMNQTFQMILLLLMSELCLQASQSKKPLNIRLADLEKEQEQQSQKAESLRKMLQDSHAKMKECESNMKPTQRMNHSCALPCGSMVSAKLKPRISSKLCCEIELQDRNAILQEEKDSFFKLLMMTTNHYRQLFLLQHEKIIKTNEKIESLKFKQKVENFYAQAYNDEPTLTNKALALMNPAARTLPDMPQ